MLPYHLHQFPNINKFQRSVDFDLWRFAVGDLVAEGGDHGIVIRVAEGSEHIGDDESRKPRLVFFRPGGQQFAAFTLGAAEGIVALLLGGRGEQHVGRGAGIFEGGDKLVDQEDVGVVDGAGIVVAVERGEVDDDVALADEVLEQGGVIEKFILKGNTGHFLLLQAEEVKEMGADEAGLSGDADGDHFW